MIFNLMVLVPVLICLVICDGLDYYVLVLVEFYYQCLLLLRVDNIFFYYITRSQSGFGIPPMSKDDMQSVRHSLSVSAALLTTVIFSRSKALTWQASTLLRDTPNPDSECLNSTLAPPTSDFWDPGSAQDPSPPSQDAHQCLPTI